MKVLNTVIYVVFLTICALLGAVFHWARESPIVQEVAKQKILQTNPEQVFDQETSITMLVLGCDEDRDPESSKVVVKNARSDMMFLVKFDFKKKHISGMSIPRDLLVEMPGYAACKINAFHKYGGPNLSKRVVEYLLGIPIHHTVVINYEILKEMVDLVGGVTIKVTKRMKWTDKAGGLYIDLNPGVQNLDGYNAMCYVRYRYGDSDYKRQERQREFMLAFKDALLGNPLVIPAVIEKSKEVMSSALSTNEIASLLLFISKIGNKNIQLGQIPTIEGEKYFLYLDENSVKKALESFNFLD